MVSGIISSSAQDIAKLGDSYLGMNPFLLENIAESRSDTICGVIMVSTSFLFQMVNYLLELIMIDKVCSIDKRKLGLFIATLAIFVFFISFVHSSMVESTINSTYKQIAINGLSKQYTYNKNHQPDKFSKIVLSRGQVRKLYDYMSNLSFHNNGKESELHRVQRFYGFLGIDFVHDIDLESSGIN